MFYKHLNHLKTFLIFNGKWPHCQLSRDLSRFRLEKRCCDVTLSSEEGNRARHLANAHYMTSPAVGNTEWPFLAFGGTGLHQPV